ARAGACALARVTTDDGRVAAALQYAESIKCAWPERSGPTLDDVVPALVAGSPSDGGTARFELELETAWLEERPKLLAALAPKPPPPPPSEPPQAPVDAAGAFNLAPVVPAPSQGFMTPIADR